MNITLEQHIKIFERTLETHKDFPKVNEMMAYELLDEMPDLDSKFKSIDDKLYMFKSIKDKSILYHNKINELESLYKIEKKTLNQLYLYSVERY